LRILYDGRYVQDRYPGVGRFAFDLICSAADASPETVFGVLVDDKVLNSRFPLREALERRANVHWLPTRVPPASLAEQLQPWKFRRFSADLYHVPFYVYPYLSFLPAVATIYDLIPLHFPQELGRRGLLYRAAIGLSLKRCRRVLTISEFSRQEICDYWRMDPGRVSVVYPGVASHLFPWNTAECRPILKSYGIDQGYLLYLGSNKPHKNLHRLLQAWAKVPRREERILALAGFWQGKSADLEADISRLGLSNSVRILGPVLEQHLPALYSQAEVFVFPSLYEGFGLPVLEAMACGAPVLCSEKSSLPEVVGDAAILIDPFDVDRWAEGLEEVLSNPELRGALKKKALVRAKRFHWDLSVRKLMDCYHRAVLD
jgi:alpha-1,3-rhamnosyl/mannosyltransferase